MNKELYLSIIIGLVLASCAPKYTTSFLNYSQPIQPRSAEDYGIDIMLREELPSQNLIKEPVFAEARFTSGEGYSAPLSNKVEFNHSIAVKGRPEIEQVTLKQMKGHAKDTVVASSKYKANKPNTRNIFAIAGGALIILGFVFPMQAVWLMAFGLVFCVLALTGGKTIFNTSDHEAKDHKNDEKKNKKRLSALAIVGLAIGAVLLLGGIIGIIYFIAESP